MITPPMNRTLPTAPARQQSVNKVTFGQVANRKSKRIMIYGAGGIGKTSYACLAPGPVAFFDLDNSLSSLREELEESNIPIPVPVEVSTWGDLHNALQSSGWDKIKTIVIDSVTRAEEICVEDLLENQKTFGDNPKKANTLEDYGFGKDVRLVFEKFKILLSDLEIHWKQGRNIILIAHECKPEEQNPMGANYIRYEPRLRTSKKGDNSIRLYIKEWCDFVGFIRLDHAELKEGKKDAVNTKKSKNEAGTRTMYLSEQPPFMAKHRGFEGPVSLEKNVSPWSEIIK